MEEYAILFFFWGGGVAKPIQPPEESILSLMTLLQVTQ